MKRNDDGEARDRDPSARGVDGRRPCWVGAGRIGTMMAEPVTVTPQLGPDGLGGGAFVAEVMGYGVRDRTARGRLGATNSCVPRRGYAFG